MGLSTEVLQEKEYQVVRYFGTFLFVVAEQTGVRTRNSFRIAATKTALMDGDTVASVDEVPCDTTYLFTVREETSGEQREAFLVKTDDGVRGWLNYCRHFTDVKLDKGDGAVIRDGEILCTNHGAMFRKDTGECTHGPCRDSILERIGVTEYSDAVYLTDPDYTLLAEGSVDDDAPSSTQNREF